MKQVISHDKAYYYVIKSGADTELLSSVSALHKEQVCSLCARLKSLIVPSTSGVPR